METVTIEGIKYDLPALEKDCWHRLLNGSLAGKHPFHNIVVANAGANGVHMRTVVLRRVDAVTKQLFFHTDTRSGKWAELQENPQVSILLYDAPARIQLRLSGTVSLHSDDTIADAAWAKSPLRCRKVYIGETAPSTVSTLPVSGMPPEWESENPPIEACEKGRSNFGVVAVQVNWMEWLWLNHGGHRRAAFCYKDLTSFDANWLVP